MDVSEFDFALPPELIAQAPPLERGTSRLLVLRRDLGTIEHTTVGRLPSLLREGDLLVLNDTKVFPARLLGTRVPSGGAVECVLLGRMDEDRWDALVHPGQKLKAGSQMLFQGQGRELRAEVLERHFQGRRTIRLWSADGGSIEDAIDAIGHIPLPPYIRRPDMPEDRDRYQAVYARERGSVAAPTAGLHFTHGILDTLTQRGIELTAITLHVGYGTFKPVRVERVEEHSVDAERFTIEAPAAAAINRALAERRRVVAVGTTTTRALEAAARESVGALLPHTGLTDLFIYPGFTFRIVSGLLTNFHLPRSSLLMLVAALAGRDQVLAAYHAAIAERYRFYSYGDAMLVL